MRKWPQSGTRCPGRYQIGYRYGARFAPGHGFGRRVAGPISERDRGQQADECANGRNLERAARDGIRSDTVTAHASPPATASEDALRVRSAKEIEASRLTNAQMAAIWNALPGTVSDRIPLRRTLRPRPRLRKTRCGSDQRKRSRPAG